MAKAKKESIIATHEPLSLLRKELLGLFLLAIGIFYYLCTLSFNPLDPSLFTSSDLSVIHNLGGIFGAYLTGLLFFLFGAASYIVGGYFLLNAFLVFTGKRTKLKWLDFVVFLICAVFISVFLQLEMTTFRVGAHVLKAGGTVGTILADIGTTYLGRWGVRLIVVFGSILTFVLGTRLSLIETARTSSLAFGKGAASLNDKLVGLSVRFNKWLGHLAENFPKPLPATAPLAIGVPLAEKTQLKKHTEEEPETTFTGFLKRKAFTEPTIRERKDKKVDKSADQFELKNMSEGYQLPTLGFLDYEEGKEIVLDAETLKLNAKILEKKLKDFAIDGVVTEIHPGPVITMYEFEPAPGIKLSKIVGLCDDLSLAMGGRSVRIVAPLPNKPAVGIEIPNHDREMVWLKDIIGDDRFQKHESKLVFAIGKDIEGIPYMADLQKMPHLLVAGATGAGKSVSINTMVCSMLYKARPDEVRMIMIDPKMIELSIYEGIPHLMLPVVTDPRKANLALKWAVREMERRYKLLSDVNARNLATYNKKIEAGEFKNKEALPGLDEDPIIHAGKLPLIVIIIDEFADLMMVASKEIEESVCRLAQKARAAGLHVILATQRPSVDVITGIIKANFPSRISFKVSSRHDSRTILDGQGAEHLLGMGDMLFVPPGTSRQVRLHGAYIGEKEITNIVNFLKDQAKPTYHEDILNAVENPEPEGSSENGAEGGAREYDEYYDQAVALITKTKRVSISSVQRQFRIGYNRAARIVEKMEEEGVVSGANGQGQREVLVGEM
jgi:S-DNA-T family DNA segregation ATPase FtsK/SpoIIIE